MFDLNTDTKEPAKCKSRVTRMLKVYCKRVI